MRMCHKMRCEAEPVAAMSLRYEQREVWIDPVPADRDPGVVELCREHVERVTPPIGWSVHDRRPQLVG
jgi:hypothetical protein